MWIKANFKPADPFLYLTYVPQHISPTASEGTIEFDPEEQLIVDSITPNVTQMDVDAPITIATLAHPLEDRVTTLEHQLQQLQAEINSIQAQLFADE